MLQQRGLVDKLMPLEIAQRLDLADGEQEIAPGVRLLPLPGHTPGHLSVICVDDAGNHVMLAGDATDTLEQLHARRADAVAPDPKVHVATLGLILEHCASNPTVYLPSHDPESAARLAGSVTVG